MEPSPARTMLQAIPLPENPEAYAPTVPKSACWLPPGAVSKPGRRQTVEEVWYCLSGSGPLTFVIVSMPPWPGAEAAAPAAGFWPSG